MELTTSYERALPIEVLERYRFCEARNAAAVMLAADPDELNDVVEVLHLFSLTDDHLLAAGGNEGPIAKSLNHAFRERGWRESEVFSEVAYELKIKPYRPAGERFPLFERFENSNGLARSYLIDNFKGRVALDVEWNAKDGNLDRDLAAYRAYYDAGIIDAAVMITRDHFDLRDFAWDVRRRAGMHEEVATKFLDTTTTTNMFKLVPKMERGDAGGCPLLAVAIAPETYR